MQVAEEAQTSIKANKHNFLKEYLTINESTINKFFFVKKSELKRKTLYRYCVVAAFSKTFTSFHNYLFLH
jgi:hypothetical protein